ncbi:hypothetical protein [Wolbachia endosymbiont of Mansonella perstans]|uniref:hypothetical protein n=1 Tax=Wolbachia endosymbiont of Mansonella perstans TaxID=229526 RepID=UPI001CE14648|nr:hypothetical protein [Wolbachia endosymbiont of Mansonella perstans]MCA4774170.1 hypothetical protein [Wolbachia endosymbiont of Mansonella perstans]
MHVYCGSESLEYMLRKIPRVLCNLQTLYEYTLDWQKDSGYQCDDNINHIRKLRPEIVQFALPLLNNLEYLVNAMKEKSSIIRNSTIMKFLLSIAKNDKLHKELEILSNLIRSCDCIPGSADYKKLCSQLNKVMTDFELPNLEHKICLLELLSKKIDFAVIKAGHVAFVEKDDNSSYMESYENMWLSYDIVHDTNFKQVFIDKAINE